MTPNLIEVLYQVSEAQACDRWSCSQEKGVGAIQGRDVEKAAVRMSFVSCTFPEATQYISRTRGPVLLLSIRFLFGGPSTVPQNRTSLLLSESLRRAGLYKVRLTCARKCCTILAICRVVGSEHDHFLGRVTKSLGLRHMTNPKITLKMGTSGR